MLNKKLLGSVSSPPSDDNFENVSLLLSGDGTNGAQNNTFLDSSTNNFTITRNGNTTQGSFSPYGSNWSNFFNGSSSFTLPSNTALNVGTGNFTVEFWIIRNNTDAGIFKLNNSTTSTGAQISTTGTIGWWLDTVGLTIPSTTTLAVGAWYHVAYVRSGTTFKLYVNGVEEASTTDSTSYDFSSWSIGRGFYGPIFNGYLSNFRVNKGTAVYTANFTPSSTPLTAIAGTSLLTCQSNRFRDASSNNFTLTLVGSPSVQRFSPFNPTAPYSTSVIGGSGYFDGSGDYLSTTNQSALTPGSGDFVIEFWAYPQSFPTSGTYGTHFFELNDNRAGDNLELRINTVITSNNWNAAFYVTGGYLAQLNSGIPAVKNAWTHIALVRTGTTLSFYVNGVRASTATISGGTSATSAFCEIGRFASVSDIYLTGYLSDTRYVKGSVSGYDATSSTIPVPTAPLTAVSGTTLFPKYQNTGIPDLAMQNNLETVGNAQVSTSVKKYGTGSLAFDGSGDGLAIANTLTLPSGTGDFTIECWLYLNILTSGFQGLISSLVTNAIYINFNNANVSIGREGTGADLNVSYTLPTTTWFHLAFTRSGTTMRIFVNGNQIASGTVASNYSASAFRVSVPNSEAINGNIDDFRISKFARYTANFTPPASALPSF